MCKRPPRIYKANLARDAQRLDSPARGMCRQRQPCLFHCSLLEFSPHLPRPNSLRGGWLYVCSRSTYGDISTCFATYPETHSYPHMIHRCHGWRRRSKNAITIDKFPRDCVRIGVQPHASRSVGSTRCVCDSAKVQAKQTWHGFHSITLQAPHWKVTSHLCTRYALVVPSYICKYIYISRLVPIVRCAR